MAVVVTVVVVLSPIHTNGLAVAIADDHPSLLLLLLLLLLLGNNNRERARVAFIRGRTLGVFQD